MAVADRIREEYPTLAWLIRDPEIGPLLRQAVDPNKGFSATTFQAKLYQTRWWRTKSKSQREWLIRYHTDRGEANRQIRATRAAVSTLGAQMGAQLSTGQIDKFSKMMLTLGISPDDAEGRAMIASAAKLTPKTKYQTGDFQTATASIEAMSENEFFLPISNVEASKYARRVIQGTMSMENVKTAMMSMAVKRFPHLREQFIQGLTPGDIVAPYRQIVAEELELGNPDRIDVAKDPAWRQLMGIHDPGNNKMRLPTESEVIKMARSRPEYWKTDRGQQASAGMASSLLQMFGKRAGVGGG